MEDTQLLHLAAGAGNVDEVRRLVKEGGVMVDPNSQDLQGWSPLHTACRSGHFAVVRYLVEDAGVKANAVDRKGWTALHVACDSNVGLPLIQYLVEMGGLSVHATTLNGITPLHLACSARATLEVIRYLVESQQADVCAEDRSGCTPLTWAIKYDREEEAALYLLRRVEFIDEETMLLAWKFHYTWDVKKKMLEKYAAGRGQSELFVSCPVHTVLTFPLPWRKAFMECVLSFPPTVLSRLDNQGRLPVHIALTSSNPLVQSPSLVALLVDREPRLPAVMRDPATGLFPYETVALLLVNAREPWSDMVRDATTNSFRPSLDGSAHQDGWRSFVHRLLHGEPARYVVPQHPDGLFPYQMETANQSSLGGNSTEEEIEWFNLVHELFRDGDPVRLLHARGLTNGCDDDEPPDPPVGRPCAGKETDDRTVVGALARIFRSLFAAVRKER